MAMAVAAVHSAQQGGRRVRLTEITETAPGPYGYRADYELAQLATLGKLGNAGEQGDPMLLNCCRRAWRWNNGSSTGT